MRSFPAAPRRKSCPPAPQRRHGSCAHGERAAPNTDPNRTLNPKPNPYPNPNPNPNPDPNPNPNPNPNQALHQEFNQALHCNYQDPTKCQQKSRYCHNQCRGRHTRECRATAVIPGGDRDLWPTRASAGMRPLINELAAHPWVS